jgi:radical SAM superfamily enzyme YgiQ (UPF0313 family)
MDKNHLKRDNEAMKVLLVYPDIQTLQFPHFQHGVASISATLKRAGHPTSLIYLSRELEDDSFIQEVQAYRPDLVAFSSTTMQYPFARRYGAAIKSRLGLPILIGGIHATIAPEEVMKDQVFNDLIRAEGEYPLLEYAQALERGSDPSEIRNLWRRLPDGTIRKNPLRPPADLEQLPLVDRELFDNEVLMRENDRQVPLMASRGCPYACTYCCNSVLSELAGGAKNLVRQRRVESVMAEIEDLHRRYPDLKSLIFMDEIFTLNRKWVREFCAAYRGAFTTPFQIFLRVETVDRETLGILREAGLYSVIVGVESGSERIRREVLNRHMTNEQIIRVFAWADELGLETWDFNMIGLPTETAAEIRETMEINRRIRPHHITVTIFYPFPGTPIHERCEAEGILQVADTTSLFLHESTLNLPTISRQRLQELAEEFRGLAMQIEAGKTAQGYLDLTAAYEKARVTSGGPKFVALWQVRISGEDRICLLLHPPSAASYTVAVKPQSLLRFSMAFSPDVWDRPGGGCLYRVKVKAPWRKEKVVFEREFDPKRRPEERGWVDAEVDLSEFGGKTVTLTLETSTPNGPNDYCVAFWSRPHLAQKEAAAIKERRSA